MGHLFGDVKMIYMVITSVFLVVFSVKIAAILLIF